MGLNTERYVNETITKYNLNEHYRRYLKEEYPEVKSLEQIYIEDDERNNDPYVSIKWEIVFLAMLRWFFSHEEVPKDFFKKDKLSILDVGCGNMPYAVPLKLFFEHAGGKNREIIITGCDTDTKRLNTVREELNRRGVNIKLNPKSLENLSAETYDIITCFNCNINSNQKYFFNNVVLRLAEGGIFLMSFKLGKDELKNYQKEIKSAGLRIVFGTQNEFDTYLSEFQIGENNRYLCVATRED